MERGLLAPPLLSLLERTRPAHPVPEDSQTSEVDPRVLVVGVVGARSDESQSREDRVQPRELEIGVDVHDEAAEEAKEPHVQGSPLVEPRPRVRPNREVEREALDGVDGENGEGRGVREGVVQLVEEVEVAGVEEAVLPVEEGVSRDEGEQQLEEGRE